MYICIYIHELNVPRVTWVNPRINAQVNPVEEDDTERSPVFLCVYARIISI